MRDKKQRDEPKIEALLEYANSIIATSREPFLVLDKGLRIVYANQAFYTAFKVAEKNTIGRLLSDLGNRQWDIPELLLLLEGILPKKKIVKNYEVRHKFEQIGERIMALNARQLRLPKQVAAIITAGVRKEAGEDLILLSIEDITEHKRVQAEEQRYRTLVENLPQKVFLKDRNSVYISCNENYAKDLKIKPVEIAGKTDYDFFPTYLAEKYRADDMRIMKSGKTESIEEEYMVMKDFLRGSQKMYINTVKAPVLDKAGNVTGLFGLFWDITGRKKAEEALNISERKIRAIFDQTFQFIGMMTVDGTLIEANRTAMQFAGISESDCLGKPFWDTPWWTHSEEMQDKLRDAVKRAVDGETVFFEATHLDANKVIHYIDFSLKPIKNQDGNVIFLIPEGRDITERKKNEEELKKYRTLFECARDGIILMDLDTGKFTMCNKAICDMLQYTNEEIKHLSVNDIHPEKDLPQVMEAFEKSARGESYLSENVPIRRKNGSIFYADIAASRIALSDKKYLMGSFRDITDRKNRPV
ncbi:MAG: PAS domain S-box protein [Candidatus Pacebacteria bacterium]|nr:PAS domain S-box protein [Candidatus Paceibacterota bacterium]